VSDLKERILKAVQPDLDAIETALAKNLNPHLDLVRDVAGHILFSGGKRLRPLLMVLSARLCEYRGDYDKTFSTALEYLHAATLLHDDLVDGASLRRNQPAAHLKWGNSIAVLVGDFLLARALSVSAATGRARIVQTLAELTEQMSQGEVHQLMRKGDIRLSEAEYLEVIRRKTAVLFETACRVSAVLADASTEKESALAAYGLNLGMAFQIADDLFDYTLGTSQLGKDVGSDLREGKMTLPLIQGLKQVGDGDREWMVRVVQDPNFSTGDFSKLVGLLQASGATRYAEKAAEAYIFKAKAALALFPQTETLGTLIDIADYALHRRV
jgi:octaprenyl-diphosphate synthase